MSAQLTGEPVIIEGNSGTAEGQATTTPKRILVKNSRGKESFARGGSIKNLDASIALRVSFGGSAFATIAAGGSLGFEAAITQFVVKSASGSINWEATLVVA